MSRAYRSQRDASAPLLVAALVALGLCSLVLLTGCQAPPPNLTPQATQAFYAHRVVKGLDILRDTAIDANAQTPPLLSEATTRKVVTWHQSALKTIQAIPSGWQATVSAGLDELLKDLPPAEANLLRPYVAMAKTLIAEVR